MLFRYKNECDIDMYDTQMNLETSGEVKKKSYKEAHLIFLHMFIKYPKKADL